MVLTFRSLPVFLSRPLRGHPPLGGGDFASKELFRQAEGTALLSGAFCQKHHRPHEINTEGPAIHSPLSLRAAKRRTPGWPLLPLRGNSPSGNLLIRRTDNESAKDGHRCPFGRFSESEDVTRRFLRFARNDIRYRFCVPSVEKRCHCEGRRPVAISRYAETMTNAPKTGTGVRPEVSANRRIPPGDSFASLGMTSGVGFAYHLPKSAEKPRPPYDGRGYVASVDYRYCLMDSEAFSGSSDTEMVSFMLLFSQNLAAQEMNSSP